MSKRTTTPVCEVEAMLVSTNKDGLQMQLSDWQNTHVFVMTEAQARSLVYQIQDRLNTRGVR